jgi:GT2 family glycosyltransferase
MEPKVGIVLVNYNGAKFQNDSIRSVQNLSYHNYEVIVVDNASTDNSIMMLREEFPWVTIIDAKKNLGVAAGNNIGIKYAIKHGADYIMLLNNDV